MKLTLRTVDYTATRPSMNIRYARKNNIVLHKVGKNYETTVEGNSVDELQKAVNEVVLACKRDNIHLAVVVTEDILNGPREPIEGWKRPDLSGLREAQLRALCDELGLLHTVREGRPSLFGKLDAYFIGQESFYRQFKTEGKNPPMPPQSIKQMQAMAKAQDEQDAKKVLVNKGQQPGVTHDLAPLRMDPKELEKFVSEFTDKDALIQAVKVCTGKMHPGLNKRLNIANLRKKALKILSVARIEAKGGTV
jgi:hypothetical protein